MFVVVDETRKINVNSFKHLEHIIDMSMLVTLQKLRLKILILCRMHGDIQVIRFTSSIWCFNITLSLQCQSLVQISSH